ncbi:hypothetical protein [Bacillus safensis]
MKDELLKKRVLLEKFEIERVYLERREVEWVFSCTCIKIK